MATYNIDELKELKEKAANHIRYSDHTQCRWLYRNKSKEYFEDILNNHDGLMTPYVKDPSGDPKNPINGLLSGLFFMARHEDGQPPATSAFGPVRFQLPTQELLPAHVNIYFADFYCMQSSWHYVTLVVTSHSSSADRFCQDRLLRLNRCDKQDNPFLYSDFMGNWWVSNACYFHVEVFYTDNIRVFFPFPGPTEAEGTRDIFDVKLMAGGREMKVVPTFGRGSSTPGGLRKNSRCSICNLSPMFVTALSPAAFSW